MKTIRLALVLVVIVGILASDYGDASATADAKAGRWWAYAYAATYALYGNPCVNINAGFWPVSASCYSISSVGEARAYAYARPGRRKRATQSTWTLGLAWAKDGSGSQDTMVSRDTLDIEVDTVGADPSKVAIHIHGYLQTYKTSKCEPTPAVSFEAKAYEVHTGNTCFYGSASLEGLELTTSGALQLSDFSVYYVGDSSFAIINYYDTVSYTGIEDSLYIDLTTHGGPTNIPTLTEWGLIIFGVMLLGFITWVFLKKKQVIGVR